MGAASSVNCLPGTWHSKSAVRISANSSKRATIPQEVQIAHFTPSSFPLVPIINGTTSTLMADSWTEIVQHVETDAKGVATSGLTTFYKDFYHRLAVLDTSGQFEAVLTRNIYDPINKMRVKGGILVRMIEFIVSIEDDNAATRYELFVLGKLHSHKGIRPWQYSIFVQTLLLTVSSRLGDGATHRVMNAWVNKLAFIMRSMLPAAIQNQVVGTEICFEEYNADSTPEMVLAGALTPRPGVKPRVDDISAATISMSMLSDTSTTGL